MFYRDMKQVFSAPAHFSSDDWFKVGAVLGTAAASALFADEAVRRYAEEHRDPFLDELMPVGDHYGRLTTGYSIGSIIYLSGLAAGDDDVRLTGRAVLEAHTFAMVITGIFKSALGRSRPFTDDGCMTFGWFESKNQHWSCPSGHAAGAFAVSSALSARIRRPWATAGLFSLSALTLTNRIYDDKHWLSDTIIGAAIGTAVGLAVGNMVNDEEEAQKKGFHEPAPAVPIIQLNMAF
jgi:hypothetical protein